MIERKIRLSFLIFGILVYTVGFLAFTYQQMPNYFSKDLMSYDESTNAVVAANITRDFFPPRLRLNPIDPEYAGWKEGPDFQHIPPLTFYVPYPFFLLDQRVSIEVYRLSYVFLAYLQGLIFLMAISALYKKKRAIFAAAITSWIWLLTPFVRQTLNANAFGYSDIVLSFSVVAAIMCIYLLILNEIKNDRYRFRFFLLTVVVCTLPIMVKNALGALPLAIFWIVMYKRGKSFNLPKFAPALAVVIPIVLCLVYYGVSFWKSPEAFKAEFFVAFQHFGDYEGWAKPWHYFITNYLPDRYFGKLYIPFILALGLAIWFWRTEKDSLQKKFTGGFLLYFAVVLVVISIVTSKSANFALQGYLFLLFFVIYSIINKISITIPALRFNDLIAFLFGIRTQVAIVSGVTFGFFLFLNIESMMKLRHGDYIYETSKNRYFQVGELADQVLYADVNTLFILDTDTIEYTEDMVHEDPDYWMRYNILFNSASEARRIEEVQAIKDKVNLNDVMRRRYRSYYWISSKAVIDERYPELAHRFSRLGAYHVMKLKREHVLNVLKIAEEAGADSE